MAIMHIGQHYSFDIYGDHFLDNVTKGMVTDILSGQTASRLGYDVATIHRQIFPHLPDDTPESFLKQNYYLIEFANGNQAAYGENWIKKDTIVAASHRKVIVTFPELSVEEQLYLPSILDAHGFKYSTEVIDVVDE